MNLRERVQEMLDFQKTNPTVEESYEHFYDENVVVQENSQPPRVGRALSIERQRQMNANVQEIHEFKIGAVLVDGFSEAHPLDGRSVIEMHIEITTLDGYRIRIEELGLQTWKEGRIIHERYFYDPGNFSGKAKEINALH
ncbi:nuclear transport factor 2 family protein [Pseudanabaena sp. FACHB-2040]|uniref:nuclear transport factor 2 family protein n=1 Tax=Pseudanabaena sp. FACHB-2040 TaxID=2692859 RepID=UPI001685EF70|nr:nuclear transport factor 2 family protein [Pseudanabaena sp. FACHB-2040]MBD2258430.1 nuclear transport factor 2 family protein [Pseudanabaena sp. FACHB-2040]